MPLSSTKFRTLIGVLLLCSAPMLHAQFPADLPAANPGRPTVSTPATLTPIGYLQFENGTLYANGSQEFANQFGLNQVTKLTLNTRLQLLTSWQPFAYSNADRDHTVQSGDFLLGAQAVVLPGEKIKPTVALSYFHRVYTGTAPDTDIGSNSQNALLLLSNDMLGFHIDTNYFVTEQTDGPLRRAQFGQTLSIAHPITAKLNLAGELWHFTQPLTHGRAVGLLLSPTYTVRPNLVLDTGFQRGLTSTSTHWEAFAGFTYLLPHRLWRKGAPEPSTTKPRTQPN
ncbi:MAG TPA: hypothetical protein VGB94_05105 [Acidobacteriaceae bacterium]